ncbi:MAG: ScpA family protein [Synergistaceae bacterium]|nr:ScpA family protein [Synergistaceae bacterium]
MTELQGLSHKNEKADRNGFEVQLGAFSGPLDLLCHLVESREMNPAELNLTELVSQYVRFLVSSKRTTLNEMAEFFSFASRLLLRKVHSLFPAQRDTADQQDLLDEDIFTDEEELRRMLEVFRPYRNGAAYMAALQRERERSFIRIADDESIPFYDLGDLYGLASLWWQLLDRYNEKRKIGDYCEESLWDDIPDAIPEERQVEERMEELLRSIRKKELGLSDLLGEKNKKMLIVTLLALLEMSRLGMVRITQSETLGDVLVAAV